MANSKYNFDPEKERALFPSKFRKILDSEADVKGLAEYLGVSLQSISQYRHGDSYPKTENLIKIADYFGISVDYFLGFSKVPNRDTSIQSVNIVTGLSPEAICFLRDLNQKSETNPGGSESEILKLINLLLDEDREETFAFWDRMRLFMFTDGGDFNYVLGGGNAQVPRDAALRALLEVNNDFLQKEKDRLLAQKGD